jgi:hypothetical protein
MYKIVSFPEPPPEPWNVNGTSNKHFIQKGTKIRTGLFPWQTLTGWEQVTDDTNAPMGFEDLNDAIVMIGKLKQNEPKHILVR